MEHWTPNRFSSLAVGAWCACVVLGAPVAQGETFRDPGHSYSFDLPFAWTQIAPEIVRDWDAQAAAAEPERNYEFRAAFGRAGDPTGMPRVIVSFTWSRGLGGATHGEIAEVFELRAVGRQEIGADQAWADVVASMQDGDAILDMSRDRVMETTVIQHPRWGRLRSWTVGRLARNGIVRLSFYAKDSEFERSARDFGHMVETFRLDPGVEYVGAPRALGLELINAPPSESGSQASIQTGREFHQKTLGFRVRIPGGWRKVPDAFVRSMNLCAGGPQPNRNWLYTDAFTSAATPEGLPRIVVSFVSLDLAGRTYRDVARSLGALDVDAITESVGEANPRLKDMRMSGVVFDEASKRMVAASSLDDPELGALRGWSIGWLSKKGIVQVSFYARVEDFDRLRAEVFAPVVRSFRLDEGVAFEPSVARATRGGTPSSASSAPLVVGGLFVPVVAMLGVRLMLRHAERRERGGSAHATRRARRRAERRAIEAELWPASAGAAD